MFAAALIGVVVLAEIYLTGTSRAATIITAILADAGISWKAVGATIGSTAKKLVGPLWETEQRLASRGSGNASSRRRETLRAAPRQHRVTGASKAGAYVAALAPASTTRPRCNREANGLPPNAIIGRAVYFVSVANRWRYRF